MQLFYLGYTTDQENTILKCAKIKEVRTYLAPVGLCVLKPTDIQCARTIVKLLKLGL